MARGRRASAPGPGGPGPHWKPQPRPVAPGGKISRAPQGRSLPRPGDRPPVPRRHPRLPRLHRAGARDLPFGHRVRPGAGAAELLRLVVYKLPTLFTYAIPAAALLATFLALGRLAADRELLAFQALGYSLRRLILPFLLFGALASGVAFSLSEFAVPPAEAAYRQEFLALVYRGAVPQVQQAVFFRGLYGETYYVERSEGDRLRGSSSTTSRAGSTPWRAASPP